MLSAIAAFFIYASLPIIVTVYLMPVYETIYVYMS